MFIDINNNTHKYVSTFDNYFLTGDENIALHIQTDSTPINRVNSLINNNYNNDNYDDENKLEYYK